MYLQKRCIFLYLLRFFFNASKYISGFGFPLKASSVYDILLKSNYWLSPYFSKYNSTFSLFDDVAIVKGIFFYSLKNTFELFIKSISALNKSSLYCCSFSSRHFIASSPIILPLVIPSIQVSPGVPLYLWYSSSVKS